MAEWNREVSRGKHGRVTTTPVPPHEDPAIASHIGAGDLLHFGKGILELSSFENVLCTAFNGVETLFSYLISPLYIYREHSLSIGLTELTNYIISEWLILSIKSLFQLCRQ